LKRRPSEQKFMNFRNTKTNFGAVSKLFHWATAVLIFGMLALGSYMHDLTLSPLKFELYALHKSMGMVVLGIILLRILWRHLDPPPSPIITIAEKQIKIAHWVHRSLYFCAASLPISGWIMASASGTPIDMFNSGLVLPSLLSANENALAASKAVHGFLSNALILLIVIHAGAALKHHFCDGDNTLKRMLPLFNKK
jgi:cytochrome b561